MKRKPEVIPATYICPFCKKKRKGYDRTGINYQGKWYQGCQDCFLDSIDDVKSFNEREF